MVAYEDRFDEIESETDRLIAEINERRERGAALYRELNELKDPRPDELRKALKAKFAKANAPLKLGKGGGRKAKVDTQPVTPTVAVAAE